MNWHAVLFFFDFLLFLQSFNCRVFPNVLPHFMQYWQVAMLQSFEMWHEMSWDVLSFRHYFFLKISFLAATHPAAWHKEHGCPTVTPCRSLNWCSLRLRVRTVQFDLGVCTGKNMQPPPQFFFEGEIFGFPAVLGQNSSKIVGNFNRTAGQVSWQQLETYLHDRFSAESAARSFCRAVAVDRPLDFTEAVADPGLQELNFCSTLHLGN